MGAIFILVFATAIIFPPNTVDVLTYHLPRVAHWIQAGNVEFYPTNIERQLFNNPFAEYTILHLQILSGGDFYANLVQFFSFVSLGIVASLIAAKFRLDKFYQLLTVLIVSTIPIAILQASSAKNDLVVSLFICCFLYFYIQAAENNELSNFIFAGLALGLALLTKGNAYLYCFPIGLFIFLSGFRRVKSVYHNLFNNLWLFAAMCFPKMESVVESNSITSFRAWMSDYCFSAFKTCGENSQLSRIFSIGKCNQHLNFSCSAQLF